MTPKTATDPRYTNTNTRSQVELKSFVDTAKSLFMTASLPQIKIIEFDRNPLKFRTFMRGFKINIVDLMNDDTQRLMYLIHYCEERYRTLCFIARDRMLP